MQLGTGFLKGQSTDNSRFQARFPAMSFGIGSSFEKVHTQLLARLGMGHILLIDNDGIEDTNLNRVHGSRRDDAENSTLKIDVIEREILVCELGVEIAKHNGWCND